MNEKQPNTGTSETILGTPRDIAIELESITDDLSVLTKEADKLTDGHIDQNFGWRRTISRELPDGSTVFLYYTFDRLEDNYAAVTQVIPNRDPEGGQKIIERKWSNTNPADSSAQQVRSFRTRPGSETLKSARDGFNSKDVARIKKLIGILKEA